MGSQVTIEMDNMTMLKPATLVLKGRGDPEQLARDWEDFLENFKDFLEATDIAGVHNQPEIPGTVCAACKKSKNLLKLIGGPEVKTLYTHVGKITDTDSWEETMGKVLRGIRGQTNQASARLKLMQKLPQGDSSFPTWV